MRILLQFPEGLKYKALEYSEKYQKEGHEVFISSTPCFGACGVAIQEAQMVNADKIIHFGHSKFVKKDLPVPVEYINYEINIDVQYLEHIMEELEPYTSLGLVTTIQHVHQLEEIKEFLQSKGKTVLIGKGNIASEEGQVLGCDAGAITTILDQIDAVLYVGGGLFHPTAIKITKPVFVYNPHSHSIEDISPKIEKLRKKRKGMLAAAIVAKTFGVLVSTKIGQFNLHLARTMKKRLEEKGKRVEILLSNTFDPMSLENFRSFDCYLVTACPRMSDDSDQYEKPILDSELYLELLKLL